MIDSDRDSVVYHTRKSQRNSKSKDKPGRDLDGEETVRYGVGLFPMCRNEHGEEMAWGNLPDW